MKKLRFPLFRGRLWAPLLASLMAIVHVGCSDSSQQSARRNNLGPVGPEESFERILERLKRRIEQGPRRIISSGLDADSSETSSYSLQATVTGEVFQPEQEGEPHRAEVKIRTHADYIHVRSVPETPESSAADDGEDPLAAILEGQDAEEFGGDPLAGADLAIPEDPREGPSSSSTQAKPREGTGEPATETIPDTFDDIDSFKMVYQDGRWQLTEPIDENREDLQMIFDYALDGQ